VGRSTLRAGAGGTAHGAGIASMTQAAKAAAERYGAPARATPARASGAGRVTKTPIVTLSRRRSGAASARDAGREGRADAGPQRKNAAGPMRAGGVSDFQRDDGPAGQ